MIFSFVNSVQNNASLCDYLNRNPIKMNNKDIANAFKLTAALMELHGENAFRFRSYRNAYNALRKYERSLSEMDMDEIVNIPGIGKSSAEKIDELIRTDRMNRLENYRDKTPQGVQDLLSIRGLGPGKVRTIWKDLGIESPGELLYACNENRLIEARGFGMKTQSDVKQKIEYYLESRGKWLFARIEPVVLEIIGHLESLGTNVTAEAVGELARKCPVVNEVVLIVTGAADEDIAQLEHITIQNSGITMKCTYGDTTPFTLHRCEGAEYAKRRFELTGSLEFIEAIEIPARASSDEEIFIAAGLPYIIPEMRESRDVFERVRPRKEYITVEDLKGIVHNHSTYSDGLHTLREMSEYVRDSGYKYFGISDHSKSAVYANGLSVDRVMQQSDEIDALNLEMAPFRIFKGIESDILSNGDLDYEDEVLGQFDFVVASVHSGLKMDERKATHRIMRAIENPYTDMLGHLTGRLLLSRKGYPLDHMQIIDACAEYGVAIELNANPLRLDMDHEWIPYALEKGVWISINPDAHSREGIHNVRFGVLAARKGGLVTGQCLNALSVDKFSQWLASRRRSG